VEKERDMIRFIFEQHTRLSCILRFNNTPRVVPETVADHSYYVTFLAMLIGDYLTGKGVELNMERILKMSVLHDMEEIISGDIIKVLKSGGFKKELDKLNIMSMKFLTGILGKGGGVYFDLWSEAKDKKTLEARVIDLADMVACIVYSLKEIHLGNKYFKEILTYAVKTSLEFSNKIPKIRSFVKELASYTLDYSQEDKKIYNPIHEALRILDHDE